MKKIILVFYSLYLGSCMVVDATNFRHLDQDDLQLHPVLVTGAAQDVRISLPETTSADVGDTVVLAREKLALPYTKALDFPLEWRWGGPAHKDRGLYLFELGFRQEQRNTLLAESAADRISIIEKTYTQIENIQWREYVREHLVVETYRSSQGYEWVMHNNPTVKPYHEYFTLPVADDRQLVVWFWYDEDWANDHPEWFQQRQTLSRRILDTVRLSGPK